MFADSKIPVRVASPDYVDVVLEVKASGNLRPPGEFIEDYPVVDPLDSHLLPIPLVE